MNFHRTVLVRLLFRPQRASKGALYRASPHLLVGVGKSRFRLRWSRTPRGWKTHPIHCTRLRHALWAWQQREQHYLHLLSECFSTFENSAECYQSSGIYFKMQLKEKKKAQLIWLHHQVRKRTVLLGGKFSSQRMVF